MSEDVVCTDLNLEGHEGEAVCGTGGGCVDPLPSHGAGAEKLHS